MQSFFFIPATKAYKLESFLKLEVDKFIIDFEDAIKISVRNKLMMKIVDQNVFKDCFLRIPLYEPTGNYLDLSLLRSFINKGFKKFVFPKLVSIKDLDTIINEIGSNNIQIVLLIENPQFYFELQTTILKYKRYLYGIGLGSHDFMSIIGAKHSLENLEVLRQNILYLANVCEILSIDIASMELNNMVEYEHEILDGIAKGYDAKFVIHPKQLEILKLIKPYSKEEYLFALKIKKEVQMIGCADEFTPLVIEGKVIERPHIKLADKIIEYYKE